MKRKIVILVALVAVLCVVSGCYTTGPTEVGVRTKKFTFFGLLGRTGVDDYIYQPGSTYIMIPIINDFQTLDTKLQTLEMMGKDQNLVFKTIDGNDITLDIIITYRIDRDKAPYIIQYVAEDDEALSDTVVRTITRSRPRDIFGELTTQEFYVAENRDEKAQKVREILNGMLGPYGVIVEGVLTKNYGFNPEYTKAIEDKKVADQLVEKYKSEAKAKEEEYLRKVNDAVGEVNKMVAEADGNYRKAIIEADAYYEKQKNISEAILAEGRNEAKGITEMNRALAGPGGETMVMLEVAKALKGKRIMLLPISGGSLDLKTTDINRLLDVYGAKRLSENK